MMVNVKARTHERELHEEPSNVCDLNHFNVQAEAARGESTFSENLCDFVHFSK